MEGKTQQTRTWAEIDLDSIAHNAQLLNRFAEAQGGDVMAVVKADAYGHGAVPVARAAARAGVRHFAVATTAEALELRQAGVTAAIYTLSSFLPEEASALVQANIVPFVSSREQAESLAAVAVPARCFLVVDTGMGREGLLPEDAVVLWQWAKNTSLQITGIATHFSRADEPGDGDSVTQAQAEAFFAFVASLDRPDLFLTLANSPGTLRLPHPPLPAGARGYLFRAGLLLYGIEPYRGAFAGLRGLRPALSWRARVTLVRSLPAGTTVGYGQTHTLTRPSLIATVPVGYADGLSRRLSNRGGGVILAYGHRYRIVGRVSMDQCQIDVTDAPLIVGDTVTLLGTDGDETQTVLEIAEAVDTTPHEITCALSRRVPRVYRERERVGEGEATVSDNNETRRLADYCRSVLDFSDLTEGAEYGYPHLSLCVIDAVWSLNVRYEAVRRVVERYRVFAGLTDETNTVQPLRELTAAMECATFDSFANEVFANRQRTSTKSGVLKAEAVYRFAVALREAGVEHISDVNEALRGNAVFERAIATIPGQGSGISLRYFYMLCGANDLIKPDRMIYRFLFDALGRTPGPNEAQDLLTDACQHLQSIFPALTLRTLDGAIWQYQRSRAATPAASPDRVRDSAAITLPPLLPSPLPLFVSLPSTEEEDEATGGERYHVRIREIPSEERPRERLLHFGADALNSAELLAILLRTGTEKHSAVGLGDYLLSHFNGIRGIAGATIEELSEVNGIGLAKAAQIKAAIEFGRRLVAASPEERSKIRSPRDVYNLLSPSLRDERREHFIAVLLDTKGGIIRQRTVSVGDLSSSIVHPREVFAEAIRHSAASLIVAHNHPSGDPTPSPEDAAVTRRLVEAGELLGIELLDHIVLGDNRWVSLKEKGLM